MNIDALVDFYQGLTPAEVGRFSEFYSADARFKDPFNEVSGLAAIQRIFSHMFDQVAVPRFIVTERLAAESAALLVWEFHFNVRRWGRDRPQVIRGASHLQFGTDGRVCNHRDYWDVAEELYEKLPVLGLLLRALRRMLSAG